MRTEQPGPPALRPNFQLVEGIEDNAVPNSPLRLQRFLLFLAKRWWVPAVAVVGCIGAVAVYLWQSPPTYVSRARMWETVKLRLPEGAVFTEDVQNFLGTQSELLKSKTLRNLTLQQLKSSSNAIPVNKQGQPLQVSVRVTPVARSSVFTLEAAGADGPYTQAYLNALMAVYLDYKRDVRKSVSGDTLASITEQLQQAERNLNVEQDAFATFQKTNNLVILEEEGRIAGGYLARLRTQFSDLQLEDRLMRETIQEQSSSPASDAEWTEDTSITEPGAGVNLATGRRTALRELELLKMQREKLSHFLRPLHPKIVKLDADIERAEKLVELFRKENREQLAASQHAVQARLDNIVVSIRDWETKVTDANKRIAEAERLKLNIQHAQSIYDRLLLLVQNVGISRNIDQETLSILEPASSPARSYSKEFDSLGLAVLAGLILGSGIILLLLARDDRFTSVAEINEKLFEDVVGQVPEVTSPEPHKTLALLGPGDQRHAYAESFRSLRSALMFMTTGNGAPKVVLITSALPHEGKSTVAANLARALALGGARVVLVDGDVRKGVLHELMGRSRKPGLIDALRDSGNVDGLLQTDTLANLAFISSGESGTDCGDLLLGPAFDKLLASLRNRFDYVLIDSSPLFAADDAATLASKVDGTFFVVRSGFSRAGVVRDALDLLYQRNAKVLGLIVNQVDASARSYHYYKYADYYPLPQPT